MKASYLMSKEEILKCFNVTEEGHSEETARQLLGKYGPNQLKEGKRKSTLEVFLSQFADLLVVILIAAAIISMVSGNAESTIVIFAVIIMNATKEKKTTLQISLDQFSSRLAMVIMVICVIVFAMSLYRDMPVLDSLMFAVATLTVGQLAAILILALIPTVLIQYGKIKNHDK